MYSTILLNTRDLLLPITPVAEHEAVGIVVSFTIFIIITWVIVGLRVFTKLHWTGFFTWDDYFMFFTLVSSDMTLIHILSSLTRIQLLYTLFNLCVIIMERLAWGRATFKETTIIKLTNVCDLGPPSLCNLTR